MNSTPLSRPNTIDYAKVIMIYLVVLGHYTYALDLDFEPSRVWSMMHLITLFHMPFFFYVSGMLFKMTTVKETIKKGWIQLMRPYVLMCIVSCTIMILVDLICGDFTFKRCITLAIGVITGNDSQYSQPNWSSALWFCYALYMIKILVSLIQCRETIVKWGGYFVLFVLMLVILNKGNIFPFRLDSSIVGLFFFVLGIQTKAILFRILGTFKTETKIICFAVSMVLLAICSMLNIDYSSRQGLSINACHFGKYPLLFLVSGISGTLAMLIISSSFNVKSNIFRKIALQISNGTIIILGFHWLVYKLLFSWWLSSYKIMSAILVSILVTFVCYILINLSNKFFPALLGNRRI